MEKQQQEHDYLYWEFPAYGGQQAIRMGSWKGFKKNLFKGASALQLYDLSKDPKELNDLAAEYPEIVQKMENFMEQAHTTAALKKFRIPVLEQ
jgi:arylsulfatase